MALLEFALYYKPLKVIKGQAIADFVVDNVSSVVEENAHVGLMPWHLYFNGSVHQNGIGLGILIISLEAVPTKVVLEVD